MSMTSGLQPVDADGGADLSLPVRAINRSDQVVVWEYARAKHVLQPGVETYVPYMAMVYWQGDPRAIDVPGGRQHEQFRRKELEHLRILYGVYEESEGHNRWENIPLVECYPINSDVRFETVLHDPDGVHLTAEAGAVNESQFLRRQMEDMAQQLRILQARAAQQEQQEAATAAAGIDPADLDRQETTHRTVSPEEATGQSMVGPSPARRPVPKGDARRATGEAESPSPAVTRDGE